MRRWSPDCNTPTRRTLTATVGGKLALGTGSRDGLSGPTPGLGGESAAESSEFGEEDPDLTLRRLGGVAAVDQILGEEGAEVATDRAGGRLEWVRGSHHLAHGLPGVFGSLHHRQEKRDRGS